MQQRLLPPTAVSNQTRVVNGRSYSGAPGSAYDINEPDALMLQSNGWVFIARSGPTSARPTPTTAGPTSSSFAGPGEKFFDTTIGALIVCDGLTWRSPVDGSAV